MDCTGWRLGLLDGRRQQWQLIGEVQPDAAVGGTDRTGTHPDQLARGAQLVEVGGSVAAHPQGQHIGFECAGHQGGALQHAQRLDQRLEATTFAGHAVP